MTPGKFSVLTSASAVLLDFDGPMCSVFAHIPAQKVASELASLGTDLGIDVPESLRSEEDPIESLRRFYEIDPRVHPKLEEALSIAEVSSAAEAEPTPGSIEFMRECINSGKSISIVSNNSPESVYAYIDKHAMRSLVSVVIGRSKESPKYLKPHPRTLNVTLDLLNTGASSSVFIGDSATDIEAAHAVGVPVIGYANRDGKVATFEEKGAYVIVTDMEELAFALRS